MIADKSIRNASVEQLFHTIGHFAQCLRPSGSRIGHQQNLQSPSRDSTFAMVIAVYTDASRAATGMFEVFAIIIVRSISLRPVCGSTSSGNSVKISTTSLARSPQADDNHNIRFRLFRDGMLKHCLTCTERARDKARSSLYNRIHRVDNTNSGFSNLKGRGFSL